jgi:hypothetical protein
MNFVVYHMMAAHYLLLSVLGRNDRHTSRSRDNITQKGSSENS